MMVPLSHVLIFALALFGIGLVGIFSRRDAVSVFLSVEILLNAGNVAFLGFSQQMGDELGHVVAFVVIAVAAAEAAVGLAIVLRLNARQGTLVLREIRRLKG
jgi:NADH-quinone oxidoreductase subunit K